ncbi:MAG: SDR family oxidoreductase [Saprospiraceae bacterium]
MKILITGGAGFIGSNLAEALLSRDDITYVRVLDDLSTGFRHNINDLIGHPKFEFVQGDIRDYDTCVKACKGMDIVSHQAALGSVPRSIKDPITTNAVNITGTLNVYTAAKEEGIKKVIFAASSSTYGDDKTIPKVENKIGNPLSPYAVTKYVSELYAKVFADLYDMNFIGLRYFNVFGPKQDPNGAYAAVIPLFMKAALEGKAPTINGDGSYSRDFTYIDNVVEANIQAMQIPVNDKAQNEIYNIAYGKRTTLNELWSYIKEVSKTAVAATHAKVRMGDVPHSLADISKARKLLGYGPLFDVKKGLFYSFEWYKEYYNRKIENC